MQARAVDGMRLRVRIRGFNMIELLIGIAIMGIVIMLGLPSYRAWIQNAKLRAAAESILSGLQLARIEATKRNTPVQFIMDPAGATTWTVACPVTAPADCPVVVTSIEERKEGGGPAEGIVLTPVAPLAAPVVITFDNFGGRANPPAAAGQSRIDLTNDPGILSTAASRPLSITIETSGGIKMCSPLAVDPNDPRRC